jgi:hypothetical protein
MRECENGARQSIANNNDTGCLVSVQLSVNPKGNYYITKKGGGGVNKMQFKR